MKEKVLVAMSGGIDSAVTALLLKEQGYDIVGMTMKTWDYASASGAQKETGCCSLDSINDARNLAVRLGFPHYIIDIREEFEHHIVDNFIDEYMGGRTPNPCVLCNTHIKWDALLHRADKLGCQYLATGHYGRIRYEDGRYRLAKGLDRKKDQSYFLWGLSQENLSRTLMPLGKYVKDDVKKLAAERGFTELARKRESYEICFVPDDDYRGFLRSRVKRDTPWAGNFVDHRGKVLGRHRGYPFYTIGQRRGLGIAGPEPYYVTEIRPETNEVVLGVRDDLMSTRMLVKDINLIKWSQINDNLRVLVKIRYKDRGKMARIRQRGNKIYVDFERPVRAIAPGQSAVFFKGSDVVGGGFIEKGDY